MRLLPTHKKWLAMAVIFALVLLFLGRGLRPGYVWLPLDLVTTAWPPWQEPNQIPEVHNPLLLDAVAYIYPVKHLVGEALRAGEWPLWNPYVLGGYPLTYNTQAGVFYPLTWLYGLLPPAWAVNLTLLIQLCLGGWFMLGYLRQIGLRWGAALFGAILFIFNGQMMVWLSWQVVHTAVVWLPLQWWLIEQLRTQPNPLQHRKTVGQIGLFAVAFALPWLGGHWTWAVYGSLTTAAYAVWRARGGSWRGALLGLGLGTAVSLPQVMPAFVYLLQGHRAPLTLAESLANGLLNRAVLLVAPNFFGSPVTADWWGPVNFNESTFYMGLLPLLLTAVVLLTPWRTWSETTRFWVGWGGLGAAWALGPGYLLLYPLPVFNGWLPSRASLIPILAVAVLAPLGLEKMGDLSPAKRWRLGGGLMGLIMALGLLFTLWYGVDPQSGGGWLTVGILLVLVWGWLGLLGQKRWRVVWSTAVVLLLFDLALFGYDYNTAAPINQLYPITATTRFLQTEAPTERIATLAEGMVYYPNSSTVHQLPNISGYEPAILSRLVRLTQQLEGERDIIREGRTLLPQQAIHHPLFALFSVKHILSIDDMFAPAPLPVLEQEPQQWQPVPAGTTISQTMALPEAGLHRLDVPLQSTEAGQITMRIFSADGAYEFANHTVESDTLTDNWASFYFAPFPSEWGRDFQWQLTSDVPLEVGQTTEGAWGERVWLLPRSQLVHEAGKTRIYLSEHYLPRAYVVPEAVAVADEGEALALLKARQPEVGSFVVLEQAGDGLPTGKVDWGEEGEATAVITTISFNQLTIQASTPAPGWLVLSDTYYPGWQASLNGQTVPIARANSIQRAIYLPEAGSHTVQFSFWPLDWLLGLGVAGLAVLLWLGLWVMAPVKKLAQIDLRLWLALLYVPIAGVMNWQVIQTMSTAFAGGRDDLWVHVWTFWWVLEAWQTGQNPFFTTLLYFPQGVPLISHNIAWLNIAFWLPMQALFGEIVAYNLMFITIFVLNSVCMYFFALDVFQKVPQAFVAGLVFGFWPYTLSHYDHPNMILLFAVPLTLLCVRRLLLRPAEAKRYVWLTAVSIALLGISRWQHLVMGSVLLVGYSLYLLVSTGQLRLWTSWRNLTTAVGVALLIMLPIMAPLVLSQIGDNSRELAIFEPDGGRTDLLAYVISPTLYDAVWGENITPQYPLYAAPHEHIAGSGLYQPFVGYVVWLLLLLALWRGGREAGVWWLLAGIYLLLALGNALTINGQTMGMPLPYGWLESTPLGAFIRRPHRLNTMLGLPVAMLVGYGTAVLLSWLPQTRLPRKGAIVMTTAVVGLLILAEARHTVPMITTPLTLPAWYSTLPERTDTVDTFGLLALPVHHRSYDKSHMMHQTQHGYPIMTGHISRMPPEAWEALDEWPWIAYAVERGNRPDFSFIAPGAELYRLHQRGVRYVVLHKALLADGLQAMWRDWLTIEPLYEDDELLVYGTELDAARDFTLQHAFTAEWGVIRAQLLPLAVVHGGILRPDVRWAVEGVDSNSNTAVSQACFTLVANNETTRYPLTCHPIMPDDLSPDRWPPLNIIRRHDQLHIPADVPPDTYQLWLTLSAPHDEAPPLNMSQVTIHPFEPSQTRSIVWEPDLALHGYDLDQTAEQLTLTTYWQALRDVEKSYKLFVHLVDPATSDIVAQSDSIPLNWTYGTNLWQKGEQVRDVAQLSLAGVPSGAYTLWVGWYDQENGENLLTEGTVRVELTAVVVE